MVKLDTVELEDESRWSTIDGEKVVKVVAKRFWKLEGSESAVSRDRRIEKVDEESCEKFAHGRSFPSSNSDFRPALHMTEK